MKVKCTQCGKISEVPNSQAQRSLRCVCKNIFLAVPFTDDDSTDEVVPEKEEWKPPTGWAVTDPNEITGAHLIQNDDSSVDEYVNYLRQSKPTMPEAPPAPRPKPLKPIQLASEETAPIENPVPPPTEVPHMKALPESPAPEAVTEPEKILPPELLPKPAITAPPKYRVTKSAPKPSNNKYILGVVAVVSFIIVLAIILTTPKPIEDQRAPDPYLTQLLKPVASKEEVHPENSKEQIALRKELEAATQAPSKSVSPLLEQLRKSAYLGDFENMIRLGSTTPRKDPEEEALFMEAQFQRATNRPERLNELFAKLDEIKSGLKDPESSVFMRTTAFGIIMSPPAQRDSQKAIETLKSLTLSRAWDPIAQAYLGIAYEQVDRLDLAHQAWEQAFHLEPQYVWVLEISDQNYRSEKRYSDAFSMAERLSKIHGQEISGLTRMGEISELRDDSNTAMEYYRKAAAIQDSAALRRAIGNILLETNPESAITEFSLGIKANPSHSELRELYISMGSAQCNLKQYSTASSSFRKALNEEPHSTKIALEKAKCELSGKNYATAAATLQGALKFAPKNPQLWEDYAFALSKTDKQKAALSAATQAIELKPTEQAHYLAAKILLTLGKKKEAALHLKKALQLNPKNREARAMLKALN